VIIGGGIDLSVGAVVALVSSLVVIMANHGLPVVVVLAGALLAGAVFGLVSGIMVSRFEITPFIATLAGLCAYRGAVLIITDGSPITFNHFSPALNYIGNGLVGPVPFPLIILVVMAVLCHLMATRTRFGLHIFALGSSEEAARLSGIITKRVQCLTYVLSGFLCGIAALIMTARVNSSQPTAGELFELDAIAAAVIGGTSMTGGIGSVPGAMLGVAIFGIIGNGLNLLNVSSYWQYVIRGVIIALAVGIDTYRNRRRK
jgi:inositol transport system permease protein